ncbi:MAG: DUF4174 domain-containing protein [Bacteroidota bacterium]
MINLLNTLNAQDLSKYRWNNRLILVLFDDSVSDIYYQQIKHFIEDVEGMEDRKLMVYHVHPDKFTKGLKSDPDWQFKTGLYQKYKKSKSQFEVVLIGLDGGVKLRKSEVLKRVELFSIIDGMPMRKAELRSRKQD